MLCPHNKHHDHLFLPLSLTPADDNFENSFESTKLPEQLLYIQLLLPLINKKLPAGKAIT